MEKKGAFTSDTFGWPTFGQLIIQAGLARTRPSPPTVPQQHVVDCRHEPDDDRLGQTASQSVRIVAIYASASTLLDRFGFLSLTI